MKDNRGGIGSPREISGTQPHPWFLVVGGV